MHVIIFSIIVSIVIFYTKLRSHFKSKENLDTILSNKTFNCFYFYSIFSFLYIVIIFLGLFSIALGIIKLDNTLIATGVLSTSIFFGEFINAKDKFSFYYNNDSFISNGKVIRYQSIKSIIRPKIPFAFYIVKTINNNSYSISPKSFNLIQDKLNIKTKNH